MKQRKKKNRIILLITIVAVCFLYLQANSTYTSYESEVIGNVESNIADWKIKVNDSLITTNNTEGINIDTIEWETNHTREGKASPGTSGIITITIDPTTTNVAFDYELTIIDQTVDQKKILTVTSIENTLKPLEKNETMGTLFNKMNYICAQAISKFLQQYEMDSNVVSYPQPEGEFKKAPAIEAKNLGNFIDWTKDAAYIQRFVRALNPFISAMTNFRGVFVKVYSAEFSDKKVKEAPGTICHVKDTIGVSTGNGVLYIKTLQFGSYMIADAKEFIEKFKPRVGEKMGA